MTVIAYKGGIIAADGLGCNGGRGDCGTGCAYSL